MSFTVPPAPSQEEAADVMAKLVRAASRQSGETSKDEQRARTRLPLAISIVLSAAGVLLLVCALAVICAPQSLLANLVLRACEAIL